MSCVVTNKWSDWSTQEWNSNKLALRVHKIKDDYVVSVSIITSFLVYVFCNTGFKKHEDNIKLLC